MTTDTTAHSPQEAHPQGEGEGLMHSPSAHTQSATEAPVVSGQTPLDSTVSVESIGKIIRRHMQDNSVSATVRSERAARDVAARMGLSLRLAAQTDPMEQLTGDALRAANIAFITDHEPESPARLDFYLPAEDLHIEVKRFHSERAVEQLSRAENVILLQGKAAVRFFASIVGRQAAVTDDTQPGTDGPQSGPVVHPEQGSPQ